MSAFRTADELCYETRVHGSKGRNWEQLQVLWISLCRNSKLLLIRTSSLFWHQIIICLLKLWDVFTHLFYLGLGAHISWWRLQDIIFSFCNFKLAKGKYMDFQDIGKVCNLMIHRLSCFIGIFDVECNRYDENHFCLFASADDSQHNILPSHKSHVVGISVWSLLCLKLKHSTVYLLQVHHSEHLPLHNLKRNPVTTILWVAKVWELASPCIAPFEAWGWGKNFIINMKTLSENHTEDYRNRYMRWQHDFCWSRPPNLVIANFQWCSLGQTSIFWTTWWQKQALQHKTVPVPYFLYHPGLSVASYSFSSLRFTML